MRLIEKSPPFVIDENACILWQLNSKLSLGATSWRPWFPGTSKLNPILPLLNCVEISAETTVAGYAHNLAT